MEAIPDTVPEGETMSAAPDVVTPPYEAPAGLAGVSVAHTQVSDVLGRQGFYHYRGYNAVDIARRGRVEDAWHLFLRGELPTPAQRAEFGSQSAAWRQLPDGVAGMLPPISLQIAFLLLLLSA